MPPYQPKAMSLPPVGVEIGGGAFRLGLISTLHESHCEPSHCGSDQPVSPFYPLPRANACSQRSRYAAMLGSLIVVGPRDGGERDVGYDSKSARKRLDEEGAFLCRAGSSALRGENDTAQENERAEHGEALRAMRVYHRRTRGKKQVTIV